MFENYTIKSSITYNCIKLRRWFRINLTIYVQNLYTKHQKPYWEKLNNTNGWICHYHRLKYFLLWKLKLFPNLPKFNIVADKIWIVFSRNKVFLSYRELRFFTVVLAKNSWGIVGWNINQIHSTFENQLRKSVISIAWSLGETTHDHINKGRKSISLNIQILLVIESSWWIREEHFLNFLGSISKYFTISITALKKKAKNRSKLAVGILRLSAIQWELSQNAHILMGKTTAKKNQNHQRRKSEKGKKKYGKVQKKSKENFEGIKQKM